MFKYDFDPFRYEGGAGAGAAGTGGAATGQAAAAQSGAVAGASSGPDAAKGTAEATNIPAAGEEPTSTKVTSNTLEDRRKAFDALINGEYKNEFAERTQQIINRRFRETKQMETQLSDQAEVMQLLAGKYGVDSKDIKGLLSAINQDDAFFEDEAAKAGLSVKQYKEMRRLQADNQALQRQVQESKMQQQAQETYAQWMREAEQVKQLYPEFDLRQELQNDQFGRLLRVGISVQNAYQAIHNDELMQRGMMAASNSAAAAAAKTIQAQRGRPAENGANAGGAVNFKPDVHKLTAKERRELAERAMRGETISF